MRIVGGCSAALFASFALIIFGLECRSQLRDRERILRQELRERVTAGPCLSDAVNKPPDIPKPLLPVRRYTMAVNC